MAVRLRRSREPPTVGLNPSGMAVSLLRSRELIILSSPLNCFNVMSCFLQNALISSVFFFMMVIVEMFFELLSLLVFALSGKNRTRLEIFLI